MITSVERLGYDRDAKLLIVHADDFGVTHSVNAATIEALESGLVTSASLMVPCCWFPEAAAYAKQKQSGDFGLHLTLTSERTSCRWGPLTSSQSVPSLVDGHGYFHRQWTDVDCINADEVELEIRAQISRARMFGLAITHLDSHQYRLYKSGPAVLNRFLLVARDEGLAVPVAKEWLTRPDTSRQVDEFSGNGPVIIDKVISMPTDVPAKHWKAFYKQAISLVAPGITEILIHVGFDDAEMRAFSNGRSTWGAEWRQRDLDFFTSGAFKRLINEHGIHLTTWREVAKLLGR